MEVQMHSDHSPSAKKEKGEEKAELSNTFTIS